MKIVNFIAVGMVIAGVMTACKKPLVCEKGNGKISTEVRKISGFTGVESNNSANVYVEQSATFEVKIEADENLLDNITTTVSNGILRIDTKGECINSKGPINVYIKAPNFTRLLINGSGDMVGQRLSGNSLDLDISGSGNINLDSLSYTAIDALISGSGDIRLNSSTMTDVFDAQISGSGTINGYSLPTKHVIAKINGSGDAVVYPIERLDAEISGSGNIRYRGNPAILNTTVSGSGSIKPY